MESRDAEGVGCRPLMHSSFMNNRILFVDDELSVLNAYVRILRHRGCRWDFVLTESGADALDRIRSERIDVVISDIDMPGMTGLDLLSKLQLDPATQDIPFIIVTGRGETGLKTRALDMGAVDLLLKPVDSNELLARLNNALRLKACADELKAQKESLDVQVQQRTHELADSRLEIIWRLAKAAECRDDDTGNHVLRVGTFSRLVAEAMGWAPSECETLLLAATLHDIGKIGIPDAVLRKPGKLNGDEWHIMQQHCEIGWSILAEQGPSPMCLDSGIYDWSPAERHSNPLLQMAADIAMSHHERWDGMGYPYGLAGDRIPLTARIVAIADVYDALRSDRPYKSPYTEEHALQIIKRAGGQHFDPDVLLAFLAAYDDIRQAESEYRQYDASEAVIAVSASNVSSRLHFTI